MQDIFKKNLSVVITTYNSATTIKDTLKSILNKNLIFIDEIIIVDDYSTDNTINILKKFKNKFLLS